LLSGLNSAQSIYDEQNITGGFLSGQGVFGLAIE